jgi:hypothetical protein
MDEIKYVPLTRFQIEPSLDDKFWEEKIKRTIQECDSVSTLREMATLLARIATQRQGVIRGLVQDMFIFNNVAVEQNDLGNPDITSQ